MKYSSQLAAFATFLCSICPVTGHCISVQLTGTMVAPKQKKCTTNWGTTWFNQVFSRKRQIDM